MPADNAPSPTTATVFRPSCFASLSAIDIPNAALSAVPAVHQVHHSDANFLLVRLEDAQALYAYLLEQGIVVRDRSKLPGCRDCLRVSIGTRSENETLMQSLLCFYGLPQNTSHAAA